MMTEWHTHRHGGKYLIAGRFQWFGNNYAVGVPEGGLYPNLVDLEHNFTVIPQFNVGDHVRINDGVYNRGTGFGVVRDIHGSSVGVEVIGLDSGHFLHGDKDLTHPCGYWFIKQDLEKIS